MLLFGVLLALALLISPSTIYISVRHTYGVFIYEMASRAAGWQSASGRPSFCQYSLLWLMIMTETILIILKETIRQQKAGRL